MYFGLFIISCFKIIGDFISFHFVINYVIKLNKLRVLSSGDFILTKIWAGAIKDADMERYLEIRITESGKVGEVLRAEAGLTKRQISQAKFRPGGILKNGKQCRVTEIAVPGDRLQVCLEAKGIDSKQLVCPDTSSFIEQGKKQLLDFERQELEDGLKLQKLQILYEDQDLLVVNKPAGMVTHPSGSHYQDSISNPACSLFS